MSETRHRDTSLVRYAVVASSMEQLMAIADSVVVGEVCEIGSN